MARRCVAFVLFLVACGLLPAASGSSSGSLRKLQFPLPLEEMVELAGGSFDPLQGASPAPTAGVESLSGGIAQLVQMPGGVGQLAEVFQGLAGALRGGVFPAMGNFMNPIESENPTARRFPFDAASAFSALIPSVNRDMVAAEGDPEIANVAANQIVGSLTGAINQMLPRASQEITEQITQEAAMEAVEQAMERLAGTTITQPVKIDNAVVEQIAARIGEQVQGLRDE